MMMRVRRKASSHLFARLSIAGLLVVFFSGSGQSEALKLNTSPPEYILKLNGPISPSAAGTIMAVSDGLFLREGMRVNLLAGADDAEAISAVVSNENAIGLVSAAGFLKARSEGLPIVAFAASYITSSVEFFSLPGTQLRGPADLEGKRIGYRPGPEISTVLQAFIAKNSVAQSKVQLVVSMAPIQDLLDRKIDVLVGHHEVEGEELERLNVDYQSLSPDSFGIHAPGPLYFTQARAFSKPRNLENFLIATANGWSAAYSDYKRTLPIIAGAIDTPLPLPLIARLLDTQRRFLRPFGTRFGELDSRRLQVLQAQLVQRRIIQETVDFTRAINDDVLKEAYRRQSETLNRIGP